MPAAIIKSLAKKANKEASEVEKLWDLGISKAKEAGFEKDSDGYYPYVVGVVKKALGLSEAKVSDLLLARMEREQFDGDTQLVSFKTLFGLEHWLSKTINKDYDGPVKIGNKVYKSAADALKGNKRKVH